MEDGILDYVVSGRTATVGSISVPSQEVRQDRAGVDEWRHRRSERLAGSAPTTAVWSGEISAPLLGVAFAHGHSKYRQRMSVSLLGLVLAVEL